MTWKEAIRLRKAIARGQLDGWELKRGDWAARMCAFWEHVHQTGLVS